MPSDKRINRKRANNRRKRRLSSVMVVDPVSGKKHQVRVVKESSKPRVKLSPVFSSKEQERLFAECAEKSMSTQARLSW